jgi:hypothetical protein
MRCLLASEDAPRRGIGMNPAPDAQVTRPPRLTHWPKPLRMRTHGSRTNRLLRVRQDEHPAMGHSELVRTRPVAPPAVAETTTEDRSPLVGFVAPPPTHRSCVPHETPRCSGQPCQRLSGAVLWFLTTSTACSADPGAGLLHPAAGHGVHLLSSLRRTLCC